MAGRLMWFVFLGTAAVCCSCAGRHSQSITRTFVITWENAPSFDDAPSFEDRTLDESEGRFSVPRDPGDPHYFKSGRIDVPVTDGSPRERALTAARAVAGSVLGDERRWSIRDVRRTRFGHYAFVEWGTAEEEYSGHVVKMMLDLDRRIIWWFKCN